MANLKHIGRMIGNKRKVIVAYRTIPNDPEHCLVVQTENLDADMHDSLIRLVESSAGQEAYEFAEAMARDRVPDGRIMLSALHATGKLTKLRTDQVEMTPNTATAVPLNELNITIAESRGVSISDLSVKPDRPQAEKTTADEVTEVTNEPVVESSTADSPLTDDELAAQYRSQADAMFKEAKRLREQAEELSPTKKKAATKKTTESA
jgi:hypothetical protein